MRGNPAQPAAAAQTATHASQCIGGFRRGFMVSGANPVTAALTRIRTPGEARAQASGVKMSAPDGDRDAKNQRPALLFGHMRPAPVRVMPAATTLAVAPRLAVAPPAEVMPRIAAQDARRVGWPRLPVPGYLGQSRSATFPIPCRLQKSSIPNQTLRSNHLGAGCTRIIELRLRHLPCLFFCVAGQTSTVGPPGSSRR